MEVYFVKKVDTFFEVVKEQIDKKQFIATKNFLLNNEGTFNNNDSLWLDEKDAFNRAVQLNEFQNERLSY